MTTPLEDARFAVERSFRKHGPNKKWVRTSAEEFITKLAAQGYHIAPLARVTDERLREAVAEINTVLGECKISCGPMLPDFEETLAQSEESLLLNPDETKRIHTAFALVVAALTELQARRDADVKCDGGCDV